MIQLDVHERSHRRALDTIRDLIRHYADNDHVSFQIVDNTGEKGRAQPVAVEFLDDLLYNQSDVSGRLAKSREDAHQQGRISDAIYEQTAPRIEAQVVPRADREGATREPDPRPASDVSVLDPDPATAAEAEPVPTARTPDLPPEAGDPRIPVTPLDGLSDTDAAVQARAIRAVEADPEGLAQRYEARFGKIVGADHAKTLLGEDYADPASRTRYTQAVHQPSSALAHHILETRMRAAQPGDLILMLSGGPGSGKTTSLDSLHQLTDLAHTIYDSNLTRRDGATRDIDAARDAGLEVGIIHTLRDPVVAFQDGVLPRAETQGRIVTIDQHVRNHGQATQLSQSLVGETKFLGGSPAIVIADSAYPTGATGDTLAPGTVRLPLDSGDLTGTWQLRGMLKTEGGTVAAVLVNLTDAPDTALVTISSASTTGAQVTSGAITFAAAGTAKDYAVKLQVSDGHYAWGWGFELIRSN